jgi:ABC-2 type transport system ATP-binding protein
VSAVTARGLGRRYGRRWALRHCSLDLPAGSVVGLVGANGAGKTTLLHLVVGLLEPTDGSIEVLGGPVGERRERVGFVAQDVPLYGSFTVADHLRFGRRLNPGWDDDLARGRVGRLGLDPDQRAGRLSGGERAQLGLTLAIAKRPDLLVLDEPVASLDPLARREFLADVLELASGEDAPTVVLSSHLLSDVERVCDRIVVLSDGRVRVEGAVEDLLASHRVLTGPRRDPCSPAPGMRPVRVSHTERQTTMLVRSTAPVIDPRWAVADVGLEELVLAYMSPDALPADVTLEAVAS